MNIPLNTLFHGDCLQLLPQLPTGAVNFVLTDPPYFANYQSRDGRSVPNDDNDRWLKPPFAEIYRILEGDSYCVSFYGWPHVDKFMQAWRYAGFRPVGHFCFPKRYTSSSGHVRCQHEQAYLLAKGHPQEPQYLLGDLIDWTYTGNKLHPTQKPLSVLMPIVETFSRPDGLVCDPFAGSASTLEAADILGRPWCGMEMDAKYHAIGNNRMQKRRETSLSNNAFMEDRNRG